MAEGQPEGSTIAQVLDEFLADEKERLSARTYRQYESVTRLLCLCLENYVIPSDPALRKMVDEANRAGAEDAVCRLCPPQEIASGMSDFLGWFMVRKVVAGQDLMRAAGTVTRRLGKWLYEHGYIDADDADYFDAEATSRGRVLPKATALRDRLSAWVDRQPAVHSEEKYDGHFQILEITDLGWKIEGVLDGVQGVVPVPAELRQPHQVGWEVSGVIAETPRGLRWAEIWNCTPK